LTIVLLVAAAAILRIRAAHNDLWLDEIWSLNLAQTVSSPIGVFTSLHHDNNHYLNTLWMVLLPGRGNWWGYRVPSVVFGIATVVVAGLVGNRRGRVNAVILMLLTTFSYFLILYSSEARGYSEEVFFCFLAFFILDHFVERPRLWLGAVFGASVILGVLSHLTFIPLYLSMIVWSAYRLFMPRTNLKWFVVRMLYCHALPMLFIAFLYAIDIRYIVVGGGRTEFSITECFAEALTWTYGGEGRIAMAICGAITVALCLSYGLRSSWRYKLDSWVLPVGLAIVVPLLFVQASDPATLYVRYFIVSMVFFLVLIGICLTSLFERGGLGRAVSIFLLAAYGAANGYYTRSLFSFGRGAFSQAVRYILQNTPGNVIEAGGNHHFRIPTMLSFYAPLSGIPKNVKYLNQNEWPAGGPEWIIFQKPSFEDPVPPAAGHHYVLARTYLATPLSGLHWFLYHKVPGGE
jgi:hypothetical protein